MNDRFITMQLFARVARTGSFSLAGRELGLSQPSVSRIIASLEKRIGVPLLRRTTRGVNLTDAGAEYLDRTDAILAAIEETDHIVRGSGEFRGALRIACSAVISMRRLIPLLSEFNAAHPHLSIEFLVGDRRHDIVAEGVDIAFRVGGPAGPDAVVRRLGVNRRLLAASPSYLQHHGTPRHPTDLLEHDLIVGPAGRCPEGWMFSKGDLSESLRIKGRYLFDQTEVTTHAAVNDLGIVSTGSLSCFEELQQGTLVPVLPDWQMGEADISLIFTDGRTAKPSARAFADFVQPHFKRLDDELRTWHAERLRELCPVE